MPDLGWTWWSAVCIAKIESTNRISDRRFQMRRVPESNIWSKHAVQALLALINITNAALVTRCRSV